MPSEAGGPEHPVRTRPWEPAAEKTAARTGTAVGCAEGCPRTSTARSVNALCRGSRCARSAQLGRSPGGTRRHPREKVRRPRLATRSSRLPLLGGPKACWPDDVKSTSRSTVSPLGRRPTAHGAARADYETCSKTAVRTRPDTTRTAGFPCSFPCRRNELRRSAFAGVVETYHALKAILHDRKLVRPGPGLRMRVSPPPTCPSTRKP